MKEIKCTEATKYQDGNYERFHDGIYKKDNLFFVTLSFIQEPELGEGNNASYISQYPLEDILDKFDVFVSDFYEKENIKGNDICCLEFASSNAKDIINLLTIVNKHVYNKNMIIDGEESVALIIE